MKTRFAVRGMSCSACSAAVEKRVSKIDGVTRAQVSLLQNDLICEYDETKVNPDMVCEAVRKAGFEAEPERAESTAHADAPKAEAKISGAGNMILSFALLFLLMYLSMAPSAAIPAYLRPAFRRGLTELLITLWVMALHARFYGEGAKALIARAPNMSTLVSLGSGAAFLYSLALLYEGGDAMLYFDSAAMIVTLVSFGKYLEARAKKKTVSAIDKLSSLAPQTAVRLRDGVEEAVNADALLPGDICLVRAGAAVPADGVILEGRAAVDESMLTGESMPADKNEGDEVAGATLNVSGSFRMRVTRTGEDAALGAIIRLVREAASSKAPVARLADKVSGIFVPTVMGVALLTLVVWLVAGSGLTFALTSAVSVLVISCPCALGLATPVAIMAGMGRGAEMGILVRSAGALETASGVKRVAFDKTGTLTTGVSEVSGVYPAEGVSEAVLLEAVASVEKPSSHPIAQAILRRAGDLAKPVTAYREIPGEGVEAALAGETVRAGNARMMTRDDLPAYEGTTIYVSKANLYLGAICVSDTPREGARDAVDALLRMGVKPCLLTGDNEFTARSVAGALGITDIRWGLLPREKADAVADMGSGVMMVGDGINDAPSLSRASLGVAIGAGTDAALSTADAVLASNDPRGAARLIELSRRAMRIVRENLFWAFFYNVLFIPVAAGALYPAFGVRLTPMLGAAAMSISSLCVTLNALRLRRFKATV